MTVRIASRPIRDGRVGTAVAMCLRVASVRADRGEDVFAQSDAGSQCAGTTAATQPPGVVGLWRPLMHVHRLERSASPAESSRSAPVHPDTSQQRPRDERDGRVQLLVSPSSASIVGGGADRSSMGRTREQSRRPRPASKELQTGSARAAPGREQVSQLAVTSSAGRCWYWRDTPVHPPDRSLLRTGVL